MKCPKCQQEGSPGAAACASCESLLSRLQPGAEFYQGSFRIKALAGARPWGLAWMADDIQTGKSCLLREYPGANTADPKRRFTTWSKELKKAGESLLTPPLLAFALQDRFYLVEEPPAWPSLAKLSGGTAISAKQANQLFRNILQNLQRLHSQQLPIFHGDLTAESVLVKPDGSVQLTHFPYAAASESVLNADLRHQDLIACGRLLWHMCEGEPLGEDLPPDCAKRLAAWNDLALAACLDWIVAEGCKRPDTADEILQFEALIRRGEAAEARGDPQQARELYDQAYDLSGSPLIRKALDRLQEGKPQAPPKPSTQLRVDKQKSAVGTTTAAAATPAATMVSAPTSLPLKVCPNCAAVWAPEDLFCGKCSTQLVALARAGAMLAADAEKAVEPNSEVAPPPVALPLAPVASVPAVPGQPPLKKKRSKLPFALATTVLVIGSIWYYATGARMKEFEGHLQRNNLVSATGPSAYTTYLQTSQEQGPNSTVVRQMNERALPLLQARSQEFLGLWYRESETGNMTWDDVVRLQDWLNRISPSSENKARLEYAAGMAALMQKNFVEARRRFETTLGLAPNWQMVLNAMGRAYVNLKQYKMAEEFYLRATQADPKWYFPHFNLANLYRDHLHDLDSAEKHYLKAIELDAVRPSFHFGLATLYYKKGKSYWSQACAEYRRSLATSSGRSLGPQESSIASRMRDKTCSH